MITTIYQYSTTICLLTTRLLIIFAQLKPVLCSNSYSLTAKTRVKPYSVFQMKTKYRLL